MDINFKAYTKDGASLWAIGIDWCGNPVIYIGDDTDNQKWQLKPNMCQKYRYDNYYVFDD